MKKRKIISLVSLMTILSLMATGCGKEIEVKNGSKVAVSFDGDKLTATEYYEKIKEDNISTLIEMIDHSLFDEQYPTDDEESEEIEKQINQIKQYYGDNEENYISIIQQYFGVDTEEELRDKLSLEYKRNKAVEEYIKENLTDKEIKNYYEENIYGEVSASHILIAVNLADSASDEEKEKAEKEAKEKAESIIAELKNGKSFSTLAKKDSDDTATAPNGGDLGYFQYSDMVEEFSNALKGLEIDEYTTEPVKTQFGYHIILKTGEKDKPKLSKVKDEIKETLKDKKLEEDSALYYRSLKSIREEKNIKWNDTVLEKAYTDYINKLIDNATSS
mgnify:CR=1 FL=1